MVAVCVILALAGLALGLWMGRSAGRDIGYHCGYHDARQVMAHELTADAARADRKPHYLAGDWYFVVPAEVYDAMADARKREEAMTTLRRESER